MKESLPSEIVCTVTIEKLQENSKRIVYKDALINIERNEFHDIILRVKSKKEISLSYHMNNIVIHKRFLKEGKASIELSDLKLILFFSNCPPKQLAVFIKILSIKFETNKGGKGLSQRERLLSEKPKSSQDISPVTLNDMKKCGMTKNYPQTPTSTKRKNEETGDYSVKEARLKKNCLNMNDLANKKSSLTESQQRILDVVRTGKNVFFTGSAGTGKSFLLKKIIGILPPDSTVVTASTGVAACYVGGTTLHSFAGIGSGTAPLNQCIQMANRSVISTQWRKCQHLIIDEISMVHGEFFQKLESVARAIRKNKLPFGGIQLILCGDFLQLPPVVKESNQQLKFCFQTPAWKMCSFTIIQLTEIHRQSDPVFINLLQNIREGRCTPQIVQQLKKTQYNQLERNGIVATHLCTHKNEADMMNQNQLNNLTEKPRVFKSIDSDPNLSKYLDSYCPVNHEVILKIGAQVMLCKNINVQKGLVNGARGVVSGFEPGTQGLPIIKFLNADEVSISYEKWSIKAASGFVISRKQLPICLAWAISIHKSQGMTLDFVQISLARAFEDGQAYVALSRSKSLEGLRIVDFNSTCVRANADVLSFYENIENY